MPGRPNVVFVFGDEWRMQATGFNGDSNCETPVLDSLAAESVNITHAVAGAPVCCPYRASLLTGQYPLTHGVYINDVELDPNCHSIARAFKAGGYETAYVGKWHVYGSPDGQYNRRSAVVPRDYQERGIAKTFELFANGSKAVMFRQPTGTGKTVCGTLVADRWNQQGENYRTMVVAHERQLIHQFAQEVVV